MNNRCWLGNPLLSIPFHIMMTMKHTSTNVVQSEIALVVTNVSPWNTCYCIKQICYECNNNEIAQYSTNQQ